jgi:hypothetical protein
MAPAFPRTVLDVHSACSLDPACGWYLACGSTCKLGFLHILNTFALLLCTAVLCTDPWRRRVHACALERGARYCTEGVWQARWGSVLGDLMVKWAIGRWEGRLRAGAYGT